MFPTNVFAIICLFAMLHLSNGALQNYQAQSKVDKVGTWIKENQNEIVRCHNDVRRKVDPPASDMSKLTWNANAAKNAQHVADLCIQKHSHPSKRIITEPFVTTCGENLYFSSAKDPWKHAVDDWFSENNEFVYGYGAKTRGDVIGHYTQVVWSDSSLVGCGYQYCPNLPYKNIYVCHYCPAGNSDNELKKPYEKGNPCSKCKGKCENKLCV
ncbi:allurin-like [Rana temporaria]|uniref:allurin-like n=1 Tax=Rana temporaria TaxID=8407 RepID=UPI001AAD15A9|nr:allurin-like [Rana temporaria]